MRTSKVLIVDDEPNAIKVLSAIISEEGYKVFKANGYEEAIKIIDAEDLDTVITDLMMPGKDGTHIFAYISEKFPDIPVIFLTAFGTVESAVNVVTKGAFYYFVKPPDYNALKSILARAVEQRKLKREIALLKKRLSDETVYFFITGNSAKMRKVYDTIEAIKDSPSSVLICGDTGTGKELVARSLHYSSVRRDKNFVAVNCAALPGGLIEAELFGYERGAFTGAMSRRIGKIEEAAGGTLFLDEIGEIEPSLQAKLLRVLQENEIERLGSNKKIKVNFRLISSSNRDLRKEVEDKRFREDLFYRINVIQMKLPPLRDRKDDIPLLVSKFLKEIGVREQKVLHIADDAMRVLVQYDWPGNVRELKNAMERACALSKGKTITINDLPEDFQALSDKAVGTLKREGTLKEIQAQAIKDVLRKCKGNKSMAAKTLGISRKAFYKKMKEL